MAVREPRRERQHGQQVIPFEFRVIRQDFVECHPGTEQVKQHFDGIAQPTNAWLAMAYHWIERDTCKKSFHVRIERQGVIVRGTRLGLIARQ